MFRQSLLLLLFLLVPLLHSPTYARHVIEFHSPNLYPESFTWDAKSDHFIVGSLLKPHLISVSDASVVSTLLSNPSLPPNSSFLGLSLHPRHHRLLAVVHRSSPPYSALASYNLPSFTPHFLTPLTLDSHLPTIANDVAVDYSGNAYVTDSNNDVIFKVDKHGNASVLSQSNAFDRGDDVNVSLPYRNCGLNGIVYNSKGYLLVVQSNTGKLFKVNADDGSARKVSLNRELVGADGMAVRKRDGVVVIVSASKLYFLKSNDGWSEGVVFDETKLDEERQASAVAVGAEDRVYVLYGHVGEGLSGVEEGRETFGIAEVESEKENEEENIWMFVLIGLGLAYFLFWRFQMKQLAINMNKKST